MVPWTPPAAAPTHAYTIEYRVADDCHPPDCELKSRDLHHEGGPHRPAEEARAHKGYTLFGNDKTEILAERGLVLLPNGSIQFDLTAISEPSRLDLSLASANPEGGDYRARIEISRENLVLSDSEYTGRSRAFAAPETGDQAGRKDEYFRALRIALDERKGGPVHVRIENRGGEPLGLGTPVVSRRVTGRGPHHAIFVIFDALAYPCANAILSPERFGAASHGPPVGRSRDWLPRWVRDQGFFFREGISPGQLTGSFVRRFFRAEFYRLDGEPSLFGQGFDETPPERAQGPVVHLAEQGFFTEAVGSNLYLSPLLSRIGFDAVYNLESTLDLPAHPPVLARRFEEAMERHAEDDAFFVLWYANTHAPWRDGASDAPALLAPELSGVELDTTVLEPMWRNLVDSIDSLERVRASAARIAPSASRVWLLGMDHGHTFTTEARDRPWRLLRETFDRGHMHCCLATQQEARTPFAIIDESQTHGQTWTAPQSSMAAWQAIVRRFGIDLGLPDTSAFVLPVGEATRTRPQVERASGGDPFDDGIVVSVGNSGALAGRSGSLAYRAYQPAWDAAPAWQLSQRQARLLSGTPSPEGGVVAEELYDLASDPGEQRNLASDDFVDLLATRRKVADFLAEYGDAPQHPRYENLFRFARKDRFRIHAPRGFVMKLDAADPVFAGTRAEGEAKLVAAIETPDPIGVLDIDGPLVGVHTTVRCGSSGLPLAVLDPEHPRFNLALARRNCADSSPKEGDPPSGEAWFWSTQIGSSLSPEARTANAEARPKGGALPELRNALRRWGYVRDK